jgi:hypothetical protein
MKKLFVCAMLLAGTSAFAAECLSELKAIDAKIITEPPMTEAAVIKMQQFKAQGEKLCRAGKEAEAMKAFAEAKKLLGMV